VTAVKFLNFNTDAKLALQALTLSCPRSASTSSAACSWTATCGRSDAATGEATVFSAQQMPGIERLLLDFAVVCAAVHTQPDFCIVVARPARAAGLLFCC
jgi:hypothetical protein